MTTSLVDNLRPVARDQVKYRDRILRATLFRVSGSSTVLQWEMGAAASFFITLAGDSSQFAVDGSNDLSAWFPVDCQGVGSAASPISSVFYQENAAAVGSIPTTSVVGNKQSKFMRIRAATGSVSRNTSVQVVLSQTPFLPTRPTKHLGPDNAWTYAASSGGITTTSAVVVKAAVNLYHRALVTEMQLSNGSATATEVILLDGATALWRGWLAAGAVQSIAFDPPLRGSANSALSIQTSVAAQVYANVQGLVALA